MPRTYQRVTDDRRFRATDAQIIELLASRARTSQDVAAVFRMNPRWITKRLKDLCDNGQVEQFMNINDMRRPYYRV